MALPAITNVVSVSLRWTAKQLDHWTLMRDPKFSAKERK